MNVDKALSALEQMTVGQLRQKYAEIFGEPTHGRHKQYLIKRIIWRMQANAYGGLSERALQRARALANLADLRLTAPRPGTSSAMTATRAIAPAAPADDRLPQPGTIVTRVYKGRTLQVEVLADGFAFDGERYDSLTAVARAATGSHWNGYLFFGLKAKRVAS